MPVVLRTPQGPSVVVGAAFLNEDELQAVVAETPSLLCHEGEPPMVLIQREVTLPEAGHLDLLCVMAGGLPVAVEVKLARNGESRREVVAQVVDYVSALTQMTVEELDRAVRGGLDAALRRLEQLHTPSDFENTWQQVGVNLRAGVARVILVLDEVRPELERIVRFLAERSSLDVRLVVISKYTDPSKGTLYVPSIVVDASDERPLSAHAGPRPAKPELLAASALYDAAAPRDMQTFGRAAHYRIVRPPDWPGGVHYEFNQTAQEIGAELHLEDDKVKFLAVQLAGLDGTALPDGTHMIWDSKWMANRGRLMVKYPLSAALAVVAGTMRALIDATRSRVAALLAEGGAPSTRA